MRWIGLVGIVVILAVAFLFSRDRRAIRWRTVGWAFVLQIAFAFLVLYWEQGKNALETLLELRLERHRLRGPGLGVPLRLARGAAGRPRAEAGAPDRGLHLRVQGAAAHHLHLRFLLDPLPLRDHPAHRAGDGLGDAADDEGLGGRGALRGRQRLHRADRSAGDDRPLHRPHDDLRAADDDDGRHGPRLGRRHARLRDDGGAAQVPDHGLRDGGARGRFSSRRSSGRRRKSR